MHRRHLLLAASAAALASAAGNVHAQSADAPLRIVVPYAAGGSSDRAARLVADRLGPRLGQTVLVENRTGASGATMPSSASYSSARSCISSFMPLRYTSTS